MVTGRFHEGELAVQNRAGVSALAARLSGMLAAPNLDGGIQKFLAARDFAVVTGRDARNRLWVSPLFAAPGFLNAHDGTLEIHAAPHLGDPLAAMAPGQPVGLLAIEFTTRRRVRVNGTLQRASDGELAVEVDQAYGNCPQYIQQRHLEHAPGLRPLAGDAQRWEALSANHIEQIRRADTFFLGTAHPTRGADASHRGGTPGFVRVDGDSLWWPDYPGNNMFNSFGNLAIDNTSALLFVDFDTGAALHLSGTAVVEWTEPGIAGDDGHTGRRVRFTIDQIASGPPLDLHSDAARPSPYNPPLS
jgi:predicted pyridoxine 5'-phosphate oxidase superfamily flavin-nucleotide-binding protein